MCYGPVDENDQYKRAIPIQPVDDPVQIYARLTGSTQAGTTEQILAALQNRQSVLDFVRNDYGDLMGQLGSEDRAKLDQHLTNVRDIETRVARLISNPTSANCPDITMLRPMQPQRQACLRDQDLRDPEVIATQGTNFCVTNFREIGQMQMDLMILALQCDLTRVASLQWSTAESTVIHEWLPLEYHGTREHHMMTHNESVDVSMMADMVDQQTAMTIRSRPDQGPHVVRGEVRLHAGPAQGDRRGRTASRCSTTCCSSGRTSWARAASTPTCNVPMVLAGSCGGQLPTGRYLDFLGGRMAGYGNGMAHNKLFVTFMKLFGIEGEHLRPAGLRGNRSGARARAGLRRMRPARARIALAGAVAVAALAGCTASPTVRGYVGAKGSGLGTTDAGDAESSAVSMCPVPAPSASQGPSAGCGKPATQTPGQYKEFSLTVACEGANARDRLYYVRLPPNYDPARPYRTVYLGPGCGPPQDLVG